MILLLTVQTLTNWFDHGCTYGHFKMYDINMSNKLNVNYTANKDNGSLTPKNVSIRVVTSMLHKEKVVDGKLYYSSQSDVQ